MNFTDGSELGIQSDPMVVHFTGLDGISHRSVPSHRTRTPLTPVSPLPPPPTQHPMPHPAPHSHWSVPSHWSVLPPPQPRMPHAAVPLTPLTLVSLLPLLQPNTPHPTFTSQLPSTPNPLHPVPRTLHCTLHTSTICGMLMVSIIIFVFVYI